jgi:hypothetical protein
VLGGGGFGVRCRDWDIAKIADFFVIVKEEYVFKRFFGLRRLASLMLYQPGRGI